MAKLTYDQIIGRMELVVSRAVFSTPVNWDDNLKAFGIDSLEFVELLMLIEQEFKITITDEVAANFKTINDFVNYIISLNTISV